MKAITLWQPWATLIALGVKTIETRSWEISHRGPIAIHAAKRPPTDVDQVGDWVVGRPNYDNRWWMTCNVGRYAGTQVHLPLGAVVATTSLTHCLPITAAHTHTFRGVHIRPLHLGGENPIALRITSAASVAAGRSNLENIDHQLPYGDWTPGRFGWIFGHTTPVRPSIPARGRQGLWTWEGAA